jgi:hypothetical protein
MLTYYAASASNAQLDEHIARIGFATDPVCPVHQMRHWTSISLGLVLPLTQFVHDWRWQ